MLPGWLATTIYVVARLSALLLIVPGLSTRFMPWRLRVLLLLLLTLPILCVLPANALADVSIASVPPRILHELVIGLSLGLCPAAFVLGLQLATHATHGMTGLPGADATGSNETGLPAFFSLLVVVVFLVSSGHRVALQGVLDSFEWLPAGGYRPIGHHVELITDMLAASFALGVRCIGPLAASLAVSFMALAALNRLLPQLGYFAVGMSVQTTALLGSMILCVGGMVWLMEHSFLSLPATFESAWKQWGSQTVR